MYLATVLDLHSRRIVGWSMQETVERSLTLAALDMAMTSRQPSPGLLHYSDRWSQYACVDYQDAFARYHMRCSMSRKGDVWDNVWVLDGNRTPLTAYKACQGVLQTL